MLWGIHLLTSYYMLGVIWFVQVVHYPLMGQVGREGFIAYEQAHARLTTYVVLPPMVTELITAGLLCWYSPEWAWWWANLVLVLLIWGSTFLVQVPLHGKLVEGFDASVHRRLVRTNWVRTVAWTVKAVGLIVF